MVDFLNLFCYNVSRGRKSICTLILLLFWWVQERSVAYDYTGFSTCDWGIYGEEAG